MRVGPAVLDVPDRHQWPMEAALGEPDLPEPEPRPPSIVNVDEVEPEVEDRGTCAWEWRKLARTSVKTGLNRETAPPGKLNCPPHCHSAEEEIFLVLEGEGACLLGDEEHPLRAGHVVARPPATRVAHAFRGGGEHGLTLLSYGTREPNDIAYYPRSKKVFFRGVGLITRVEELDYWEGE
jgi:mannose-6-phosphate isomerase-like protein (cupin superfamily)